MLSSQLVDEHDPISTLVYMEPQSDTLELSLHDQHVDRLNDHGVQGVLLELNLEHVLVQQVPVKIALHLV